MLGNQRRGAAVHRADAAWQQQQGVGAAHRQSAGADAGRRLSTADYHALARAWPLHGVVAWGLVLPTLFLHNVNTGLVTIGYDAGGTSNYSWYRVGGMTFQPAELAKSALF